MAYLTLKSRVTPHSQFSQNCASEREAPPDRLLSDLKEVASRRADRDKIEIISLATLSSRIAPKALMMIPTDY